MFFVLPCLHCSFVFFCGIRERQGKAGKVAIREHDVRRQAGLGSRQQGISLLEWKTAYNC